MSPNVSLYNITFGILIEQKKNTIRFWWCVLLRKERIKYVQNSYINCFSKSLFVCLILINNEDKLCNRFFSACGLRSCNKMFFFVWASTNAKPDPLAYTTLICCLRIWNKNNNNKKEKMCWTKLNIHKLLPTFTLRYLIFNVFCMDATKFHQMLCFIYELTMLRIAISLTRTKISSKDFFYWMRYVHMLWF